jgi:murein DD-endopeptidase MepM/ murein hydrolase activator NlpD
MELRTLQADARTRAHELATGGALALAIFFAVAALARLDAREPVSTPIAPAALSVVARTEIEPPKVSAPPAKPVEPALTVVEGALARRQTLGHALRKAGIDGGVIDQIVDAMSPVFNFRYAKVGDAFRASLSPAGELIEFAYTRSPIEAYTLKRDGEELVAQKHEPNVVVQRAQLAGVITSNLYQSVVALGESGELAHDFAEIFAWDVDFSKAQPGDEFNAVYERRFYETKSGPVYLGPGRILAARFSNRDDDFTAIYFETSPAKGGYYRPDGSAAQRQFLQAPLNYRRISSQYAASRLHPVLGIRRPHLGVDYAAAHGTPVWAVSDGTVVFVGRSGGLGNTVTVRHRAGYETRYGHLSGFAKRLRVGDRVRQKQVVGFVGSTGLSTGPHLHFEFTLNKKQVNPATVRIPQGDPIGPGRMGEFAKTRNELLALIDPTPFRIPTNEAL